MDAIFVWPCGTWCYAEELEDYLTFMSDDCVRVDVSDCDSDDVDAIDNLAAATMA